MTEAVNQFRFGKRASDYTVGIPPFAPHLEDVGRIREAQQTYVVLRDGGGNHYARHMHSVTPSLIRVYPTGA